MMNDLPKNGPDKPIMPRKKLLGIIGLVVLIGLSVYGVFTLLPNQKTVVDYNQFRAAGFEKLKVLDNAPVQPPIPFLTADGSQVSLSAFHGKVTLVNLWATWCAPCVTEMPTLANLQRKFPKDEFVVVAISVDRENTRQEAIDQLNQLTGGALTFYHDPRMGVVFPMKARGFPTTILYDRAGKELARYEGEADWAGPAATKMIEAAISDK